MNISTIPSTPGARKRSKRVGRGIGSGTGKTAARGQKGQRSRTGSGKSPGFEGSRNPIIRRLPKRGFRRKATGHIIPWEVVNIRELNIYSENEKLTPEQLESSGLIRSAKSRVALLGDGSLKKPLTISVHRASATAQKKIKSAGGSLELITQNKSSER